MILLFAILSFLMSPATQSDNIPIEKVRTLFANASNKESDCQSLLEMLPSYGNTNNETLKAYRASATMVMASHVLIPKSKLDYFKEGKGHLEEAVSADPNNLEIRLLRFTMQSQAPSFLGYNKSINEDKSMLLSSLKEIKDMALKKLIKDYLKASDELTEAEKQNMER